MTSAVLCTIQQHVFSSWTSGFFHYKSKSTVKTYTNSHLIHIPGSGRYLDHGWLIRLLEYRFWIQNANDIPDLQISPWTRRSEIKTRGKIVKIKCLLWISPGYNQNVPKSTFYKGVNILSPSKKWTEVYIRVGFHMPKSGLKYILILTRLCLTYTWFQW